MKRIAIFIIKAYQVILSPFFKGRCRFEPSCSHYAINALELHGFTKGLLLTFKRLFRCRPVIRQNGSIPGRNFGYDPIPAKKV